MATGTVTLALTDLGGDSGNGRVRPWEEDLQLGLSPSVTTRSIGETGGECRGKPDTNGCFLGTQWLAVRAPTASASPASPPPGATTIASPNPPT